MKRIYSYYESIQTIPQPEEFEKANYWKTSWEKNGWECVMLNKSHAQSSHLHSKLIAGLMRTALRLPQELQSQFPAMLARYSRLAAFHAAGGGWLCDYDLYNKTLSTGIAEEIEANQTLLIVADQPCYLVYATKEHIANAITKIYSCEIIVGNRILNESEILGLPHGLEQAIPHVHHAKSSAEMKAIYEESFNVCA